MAEEKAARPVEEMSFKEASVELEQTVRALEAGDLELEDALARYQRGVELLASLRERLTEAEARVQALLEQSGAAGAPDTTSAPSTAFINE